MEFHFISSLLNTSLKLHCNKIPFYFLSFKYFIKASLLMWVEVSGVEKFFSLLESTSNEDSFTVSIQPLHAVA